MTDNIHQTQADDDTLVCQAPTSAALYMRAAVDEIDATFGAGYAANNPALVAAFMQTCAADFAASSNARAIEALAFTVEAEREMKAATLLARLPVASRRVS